jgi:hypothetical protein
MPAETDGSEGSPTRATRPVMTGFLDAVVPTTTR